MQYLRDALHALLDAFHHVVCRLQGAAGCRTDVYKDDALVFVGHETRFCRVHQVSEQHYRTGQERPDHPFAFDEEQDACLILLDHRVERRVEGFTEAGGKIIVLRAVFIDIGFEEKGTERRAQRQRVDSRYADSHRHRQTELDIERTRSAAHKRNRNKYCHEHQRGGDNGIADPLHRIDAGHVGRAVPDVEPRLHRLDDDNRIIDHGSDHKHQCKQSDQVDAEPGNRHERKRTDQRNHDPDQRDKRRTDILQEHIHH